MARKRVIVIRLTRDEAEGLLNAGNRGVADLIDAQGDEDLEAAEWAEKALNKLGVAMEEAWPELPKE